MTELAATTNNNWPSGQTSLTGLLLTARRSPFRTLCKIALFAESAFVAGDLLKLLLLAFVHNVDNLQQFASFFSYTN